MICIIYLASRPILQAVVERFSQKGKTIPDLLNKVFEFVTKTHRYAGFLAVGSIVLHFILQYRQYGIVPVAGLLAGLFLVTQSLLGFALTKQKDNERLKKIALLHQTLGALIVVSVLAHRI